jgi:hypothetical protein
MNTRFVSWMTAGVALAILGASPFSGAAAEEDGVAVAILYDASGSMRDSVRDKGGQLSPKYLIAKRALNSIVKRLQAYVASATPGSPRKLSVGLYVFHDTTAKPVVPLGPFDPKDAENWANRVPPPGSGTPIGTALETATKALLESNLSRRHILVITDGENTVGPDPASVLPGLQDQAAQKKTEVKVNFVAFDVDARVFAPLKRLGVKVVGAANETQLNTQLQLILEKEILLEDAEPPKKK